MSFHLEWCNGAICDVVNKLLEVFLSQQRKTAEDKQNESEKGPPLNFKLEVRNNRL